MVGAELNHQLEYLHFDLAFIGAGAVQDDGVYYDNSEEAYTKHLIASRSAYVCVIYDDSKYDKNGAVKGLSFDEINVIVTNKNPPEEILNAIERSGCDLDIVEMTE